MHNIRGLLADINNFKDGIEPNELLRRDYRVTLSESKKITERSIAAREARIAIKKVLALESPTSNRTKMLEAALQVIKELIIQESRLQVTKDV